MTHIEAIKNGFSLVNRRWQLVAVQVGMMLFNCIGFFIMVGIPLGIAFVIFGLDLTGLAEMREMRDVLSILRDPAGLISKYFGLVLVVLASFLLYLILVTTVGLFVFSGSVGVIGRSVIDPSFRFSMKAFFTEAKRFFFPLMWFTLFAGLVFVAIAFALGLFVGGVSALVGAARSQDSTLALFLGIFFSLLLVIAGIAVILGALSVTVFGIAVLFFKGTGSVQSFREASRFLLSHQNAFWLYVILFVGYVLASFMVMLVIYPFNVIPIIGPIISFPFQILSSAAQGYLALVILAAIFSYYYEVEVRPAQARPAGGPSEVSGTGSIQAEGTSFAPGPGRDEAPPPSEEKAEGG